MNKLALNVPGSGGSTNVPNYPGFGQNGSPLADQTIGGTLTAVFEVVFLTAGFLLFIWLVVGVFKYMTAGGNKEGLAKARAHITWTVVGFIVVILAFSISQYVESILPTNTPGVTQITPP